MDKITDNTPPCAAAMGCLCAGHARGNPASAACDTSEVARPVPACDMKTDCTEPVSHIDDKGFVYCEKHGLQRRGWRPCRKLRPHELRRLQAGKTLAHY